jgi:Tol biopolymer transport system component
MARGKRESPTAKLGIKELEMRMTTLILMAAAAMAAAPAWAQTGGRADVLFESARQKETLEGDLKGAIRQYEEITKKFASDRAAVAKALIRMAECHQKLGDAEAKKIYERVVREFGDQKEAASIARARVGGTTEADAGVVAKQVWTGDDVNLSATVSPDGRYVVYTDFKTTDLAARNLLTGEVTMLTRHGPTPGRGMGTGYAFCFSPDGREIAYNWSHDTEPSALRITAADGTRTRDLVRQHIDPGGWSPDGKWISGVRLNLGQQKGDVVIVSTADGSTKTLLADLPGFPRAGGFSADGRYFLLTATQAGANRESGIFAVPLNGGEPLLLVQETKSDRLPHWTPDGKGVLFLSERSGSPDLWMTAVAGGKPAGAPRNLRRMMGAVVTMSMTRDGSIVVGLRDDHSAIYHAEFDPEALRFRSTPQRLQDSSPSAYTASWSPDGKAVAYFRAKEAVSRRSSQLVIRDLATSVERTVSGGFSDNTKALWFPDGRSLLVQRMNGAQREILKLDAQTGETQLIHSAMMWGSIAMTPDGKFLLYSVRDRSKPDYNAADSVRLFRREIATGAETELHKAQTPGTGFFRLSISPDGKNAAFLMNQPDLLTRSLFVIPVGGGAPRELARGPYQQLPLALEWSPRGTHVIHGAQTPDNRRKLMAIPAGGGEAREIQTDPNAFGWNLDFSADGKRVVYTVYAQRQEVWMFRNLLAAK